MAWVAALVCVQSLTWELSHAVSIAEKKKGISQTSRSCILICAALYQFSPSVSQSVSQQTSLNAYFLPGTVIDAARIEKCQRLDPSSLRNQRLVETDE